METENCKQQGNSVARDLPPTGSEANTTPLPHKNQKKKNLPPPRKSEEKKCKKNITPPPPPHFRSEQGNRGYIGYRFPMSLSIIWRNHLPFNQLVKWHFSIFSLMLKIA